MCKFRKSDFSRFEVFVAYNNHDDELFIIVNSIQRARLNVNDLGGLMANTEIRRAAKAAGVPLWAIAQRLGVSEATITRRLRVELSAADRTRILSEIKELEKGADCNGKGKN